MARRSMAQKSQQATMDNNYMIAVLRAFCQAQLRCSYPRGKMPATNKEKWYYTKSVEYRLHIRIGTHARGKR
jgi:hypothetical protein